MDDRLRLLARAHDELAPGYDASLAENPVASWMRHQLWGHYAHVFPRTGRLLDIAAGTGADALFLAERGARVVALDVSAGMLAELERRARRRGVAVETRVAAAEHLDTLSLEPESFDGALTAFAGLNTIADLPRLSTNLARLLKPRARLVVHALNAFCLWETLHLILRGDRPRPRVGRTRIGGELVHYRFYQPYQLWHAALAPQFALRQVYAMSVLVPPAWTRRTGRLTPLVLGLDGLVGRALPTAGDFFVLDLERR
ncbi:MAG: methyltransferase domain-containing protein [Chloroflexi bacterium]|nr:methyltransferase domain-containing protein [Chloroflexota bacterium]